MNRRKKIYRGFNRRNRYIKIKLISMTLAVVVIGGYGYVKLKDTNIPNIFKDNKIVSSIKNKIPSVDNLVPDAITSDDISKELDKLNKEKDNKEDKDEVSNDNKQTSEEIKVAKTEGWSYYTIQVASVKEDKDIKKMQDTLQENKIPFSIVEIDGVKKIQTYSFFDKDQTRNHLEETKKVFPDAFISEVKVPMLSLEYTSKYEYVEGISNQLNKLITNFKEESDFWAKNEEKIDMENYNKLLTDRKKILEDLQIEVNKIDYSGMKDFKEKLTTYINDTNEKIAQSSKAANEGKYNESKGIFVSCMQGYFSFISMIKGA